MKNHDMFAAAMRNYVGKSLSTSEIKRIVLNEFPEFNEGSILPNDHGAGNKGACWCVGTENQIFQKINRNEYRVLPYVQLKATDRTDSLNKVLPKDIQLDKVIESLRPLRKGNIMDLVEDAGINISPWKVKKDGSSVISPSTNPNYCFEWAFGGGGEPTALCVWHKSLAVSNGVISYEDSLRQHALKLDSAANDRTNPANVKKRARDQAGRARNFDSLLQHAFRRSDPVRVILLQGEPRSGAEAGWDTSKVKYRSLDSEAWYVHSYSDVDGSFRLVRNVPLSGTNLPKNTAENKPVFEDQFSEPVQPQKRESTGSAFIRSQNVRQTVLMRAAGICEFCGEQGFKKGNGAIYLETHHVIPLAENGPDIEWNLVALCPNDHRRAHFGEDYIEIRNQLIEYLLKIYPAANDHLLSLQK